VTIAPGSSGGGVYTELAGTKRLVGIVSQISVAELARGRNVYESFIPLLHAVPMSVVCPLLAK